MQYTIKSIQETQYLAIKTAKLLKPGMVILLEGQLGSGKTTFTQFVGKELGITRAIKSPTYTIVKEYPIGNERLIHIDAYRLEDGGAETIDFESYLNDSSIIFIEWSEFLGEFLPEDRVRIQFKTMNNPNQREIIISFEGLNDALYRELLSKIGAV